MIVLRKDWSIDAEGMVVVDFPCHVGRILGSWVMPDGRVSGRIQCTVLGCRNIREDVVLEGWGQ